VRKTKVLPEKREEKNRGDEKTGRKRPVFVVKFRYDKNKLTTKRLYARQMGISTVFTMELRSNNPRR
jgi:hypothetical protein